MCLGIAGHMYMAAVMRKVARKVGQGRVAKNLANHTGMEVIDSNEGF